jgi:hypothetical protein
MGVQDGVLLGRSAERQKTMLLRDGWLGGLGTLVPEFGRRLAAIDLLLGGLERALEGWIAVVRVERWRRCGEDSGPAQVSR